VVLADTEDTWSALFAAQGATYSAPRLRLFSGSTQSGCGAAGAEVGPFYCPADQRVYIDLGFFRELDQRFGAPGDFAQAYVIAHEVGHHVQNLLGVAEKVHAARSRASEVQSNQLQVRMELQADCYAGLWAHHAQRSRQVLEGGDLEEALGAAAAVGDDLIQKRTQGQVIPESFTHGSAAQRQQWFEQGFRSGTLAACDTFGSR
jgi:predicted metalloprotease